LSYLPINTDLNSKASIHLFVVLCAAVFEFHLPWRQSHSRAKSRLLWL